MSKNLSETYKFDKPTYSPCTLTQNVQNANKAISLPKQSAEKQQDLTTKLDAYFLTKTNKKTVEIRSYY